MGSQRLVAVPVLLLEFALLAAHGLLPEPPAARPPAAGTSHGLRGSSGLGATATAASGSPRRQGARAERAAAAAVGHQELPPGGSEGLAAAHEREDPVDGGRRPAAVPWQATAPPHWPALGEKWQPFAEPTEDQLPIGGQTEVRLPSGAKVTGLERGPLRTFFELRYARARRFEKPKLEVTRLGASLDATRSAGLGTACVQANGTANWLGSEDCHFLDVYAPSKEYRELPVMVWIHGGSLTMGYKQARWAERFVLEGRVIVVALNYRLNVFGFWTDSDEKTPKNFGIRDQIMALQWVQENIRSFGGDPDSVTIIGQSAGGLSVTALYMSPLTKGLFHRAIALSPGYQNPAQFQAPSGLAASTMGKACLEAMGCTDIACLQNSSAGDLFVRCQDYFQPAVFTAAPNMYFSGYDGEVLPHGLHASLCGGAPVANADRPLMVGSMPDEARVFAISGFNMSATMDKFLSFRLPGFEEGDDALRRCARERLLSPYAGATAGACALCSAFQGQADMVQLLGDLLFTRGPQLLAAAPGAARYRYLLDVGDLSSEMGATHGIDECFFHEFPDVVCNAPGRRAAKYWVGRLLREYLMSFAMTGEPRSYYGPRWDPVDSSGATRSLPMMRFQLGVEGRNSHMTSSDWFSSEAAALLANITCGSLKLANSSDGQCEFVDTSTEL